MGKRASAACVKGCPRNKQEALQLLLICLVLSCLAVATDTFYILGQTDQFVAEFYRGLFILRKKMTNSLQIFLGQFINREKQQFW